MIEPKKPLRTDFKWLLEALPWWGIFKERLNTISNPDQLESEHKSKTSVIFAWLTTVFTLMSPLPIVKAREWWKLWGILLGIILILLVLTFVQKN